MIRAAVRGKLWMPGLGFAAAAIVAGGIAWTVGSARSAPKVRPTLSTVGAPGTKITLPPADVRTKRLRGSGITELTLLGTVGGRSVYRLGDSAHPCYGAGETSAAWPLGVIKCRNAAPYFPSRQMPLFDFSMVGMDRGDAAMHYIRVEGVAADGVASVGLLDQNGETVERLPVQGNVYGAASLPTRSGVRLVALDASGNVLGGASP
jgi:hypothetical protein